MASTSALLELATALKHYSNALVLIGGWAPYYLVKDHGRPGFEHIGSIDIDLAIDPDWFPALRGQTGPPVTRGWIRVKDAGAQPTGLDREFPVLVCDISPPVVMNLGLFGWAPTVQLTTYVRRRPQPGWLRFAANSTEVGRGMFAEDHVVVDEAGALVAQSRQLALIPSGA